MAMFHSVFSFQRFSAGLLTGGLLVACALSGMGMAHPTWALTKKAPAPVIEGANANHPEVKALLATLKRMQDTANKHDVDAYMTVYANDFKSADNLNYNQIKDLINEAWELYPTMTYDSHIVQLRLNGSWATAETLDTSVAQGVPSPLVPANAPPEVQKAEQGTMLTKARNQLFFQKRGNTWWLVSDHTIYEEAELVFGKVLDVLFSFEAPDQVFAGNSYTARINVALPPNVLGLATINREPIQFPHGKVADQFRPIYPSQGRLERVFEANTAHRNEMVSATIGFLGTSTQGGSGIDPLELLLNVQGFRTIVKRVNISPKAESDAPIGSNGLLLKAIIDYTAKQGKPTPPTITPPVVPTLPAPTSTAPTK
ncbi:MAG: hypothetical protein ACKO34_01745 [Vampirovibrionales bacterium]